MIVLLNLTVGISLAIFPPTRFVASGSSREYTPSEFRRVYHDAIYSRVVREQSLDKCEEIARELKADRVSRFVRVHSGNQIRSTAITVVEIGITTKLEASFLLVDSWANDTEQKESKIDPLVKIDLELPPGDSAAWKSVLTGLKHTELESIVDVKGMYTLDGSSVALEVYDGKVEIRYGFPNPSYDVIPELQSIRALDLLIADLVKEFQHSAIWGIEGLNRGSRRKTSAK